MRRAFRLWPWRPFREEAPVTILLLPDKPTAGVPAQLTQVANFLRTAEVSYARVAAADLGSNGTPLVPLLTTAADLLHPQKTAVRFPRTRLVHALVTMELSGRDK